MAAMRGGERDVADEGDLFENVLICLEFVLPTVDDGDGEQVAMFQHDHDGHGEDTIDLAGDASEFSAGVVLAFQLNGEKEVGLKQAGFDGCLFEQAGVPGEFVIRELKEDVGGGPVGEESLFPVEAPESGLIGDHLEERLWF